MSQFLNKTIVWLSSTLYMVSQTFITLTIFLLYIILELLHVIVSPIFLIAAMMVFAYLFLYTMANTTFQAAIPFAILLFITAVISKLAFADYSNERRKRY